MPVDRRPVRGYAAAVTSTRPVPAGARLLGNVAAVLLALFVLDVAAYALLPTRFARRLIGYRVPFHDVLTGGQGKYPQDYFVRHPERGFDIGPYRSGTHWVEGLTYPIWSNRWGCFDQAWERPPKDYYYFAGDSMTWGYSPYEDKFATVFQARTGIDSVKCGVTHTGTRQQFAKFLDVTAEIGVLPKKVIVGYFFNDTANDWAYPHSTVVRGWLIDDAYVTPNLELVRVDEAFLSRAVDDWLAQRRSESRAPKVLLEFSFTAQVLSGAWSGVADRLWPTPPQPWFAHGPTGEPLFDIYHLSWMQKRSGWLAYTHFPYADANKEAIRRWHADAVARGYELEFLLFESPDFYRELTPFLDEVGIPYVDIVAEFRKRHVRESDMYWPHDGHYSPEGNRTVGEILSDIETH